MITMRPILLALLALGPTTLVALGGVASASHETQVCQTIAAHVYCVRTVKFQKLDDVYEPVNSSRPIATVNVQRWRVELHASDVPGDPDASFPLALGAVDDRPVPADFNVSTSAGGHALSTTATYHTRLCNPHCVLMPGPYDGPKVGELWLSYVQLTEDGFVIASTPVLPVVHVVNSCACGTPAIGDPDPGFFSF
jgi:hypothetical protein